MGKKEIGCFGITIESPHQPNPVRFDGMEERLAAIQTILSAYLGDLSFKYPDNAAYHGTFTAHISPFGALSSYTDVIVERPDGMIEVFQFLFAGHDLGYVYPSTVFPSCTPRKSSPSAQTSRIGKTAILPTSCA